MYAVIFRSLRTSHSDDLYQEYSEKMEELVKSIDGYIGHHGQRDPKTRLGITISYFDSREAIKKWREHPDHVATQELGRTTFYLWYEVKVVEVQQMYDWNLKEI